VHASEWVKDKLIVAQEYGQCAVNQFEGEVDIATFFDIYERTEAMK
jgi:hypothetical protein